MGQGAPGNHYGQRPMKSRPNSHSPFFGYCHFNDHVPHNEGEKVTDNLWSLCYLERDFLFRPDP